MPEGGAHGGSCAHPDVFIEADTSPWLCCVSFSPSPMLQPLDKAPTLPAVSQLWGTSLPLRPLMSSSMTASSMTGSG